MLKNRKLLKKLQFHVKIDEVIEYFNKIIYLFRGNHMSKRYFALIVTFAICIVLTGCEDVIDLTDTEQRLIAEYAGELLLKYDVNFDDRLDSGQKIEEEMASEAEELGETEVMTTEAATSEEASEEDNTETENGRNLDSNIDDTDNAEDSGSKEIGTESDIAAIAGLGGLSITYKDYIISDQYPAGDEGDDFISVDASEGYQLLVLRFNVTNTSSDTVNFTMLDEPIDYRIVCNGSHAANPMLTILMNDLGTIEATLTPDETQEAVLVFQVSESMKDGLESMELKVQYNNVENVIKIL